MGSDPTTIASTTGAAVREVRRRSARLNRAGAQPSRQLRERPSLWPANSVVAPDGGHPVVGDLAGAELRLGQESHERKDPAPTGRTAPDWAATRR
jgi:hypothetical protein